MRITFSVVIFSRSMKQQKDWFCLKTLYWPTYLWLLDHLQASSLLSCINVTCYKAFRFPSFVITASTITWTFICHLQLHVISRETATILQWRSNIRKQLSVFLAVLNTNYLLEIRKKVSLMRPASSSGITSKYSAGCVLRIALLISFTLSSF